MTEDNDSGREQPEKFREKRLDFEKLLMDLGDYLKKPVSNEANSRGDRMVLNVVHMMLAAATQGVYLFLYLGYYGWKFFQKHPLKDYKVEVEVTPNPEDESQEEEEQ
jgi:hypothetical protein